MKTANAELMRQAREALKGNWGLAIGAFVIYFLVMMCLQSPTILAPGMVLFAFPTALLTLIVGAPMAVGIAIFSLSISRKQDATVGQIFLGFNKFGTSLAAYFLVAIFTLLWLLLLIIPGIIAAISYSMTFFIIADETDISAMDAINKSKRMMDGYKWKYFCLGFRFIGWALLCILTLGIGFLWLGPYIQISFAKFYDDVKNQLAVKENSQPATV